MGRAPGLYTRSTLFYVIRRGCRVRGQAASVERRKGVDSSAGKQSKAKQSKAKQSKAKKKEKQYKHNNKQKQTKKEKTEQIRKLKTKIEATDKV